MDGDGKSKSLSDDNLWVLRLYFSQRVLPLFWNIVTQVCSNAIDQYKWKLEHFWCQNLGSLSTDSASVDRERVQLVTIIHCLLVLASGQCSTVI